MFKKNKRLSSSNGFKKITNHSIIETYTSHSWSLFLHILSN